MADRPPVAQRRVQPAADPGLRRRWRGRPAEHLRSAAARIAPSSALGAGRPERPRSRDTEKAWVSAAARSPWTSSSPVTYACAAPSSPGCHSIRRIASGERSSTCGASSGPATEPSHARSRTGRSPPTNGRSASASRPATPGPVAGPVVRLSVMVMDAPAVAGRAGARRCSPRRSRPGSTPGRSATSARRSRRSRARAPRRARRRNGVSHRRSVSA